MGPPVIRSGVTTLERDRRLFYRSSSLARYMRGLPLHPSEHALLGGVTGKRLGQFERFRQRSDGRQCSLGRSTTGCQPPGESVIPRSSQGTQAHRGGRRARVRSSVDVVLSRRATRRKRRTQARRGEFQRSLLRRCHSSCTPLVAETVESTAEGVKARLIEREGPTGVILTTTAVNLHPENETRMLSIPVTDTQDQTRQVLRALACEDEHDGPDLFR
jgi:hypothetical protein